LPSGDFSGIPAKFEINIFFRNSVSGLCRILASYQAKMYS